MEKSEKLRILRIELFYYLEGPQKMTGDELIELFKQKKIKRLPFLKALEAKGIKYKIKDGECSEDT